MNILFYFLIKCTSVMYYCYFCIIQYKNHNSKHTCNNNIMYYFEIHFVIKKNDDLNNVLISNVN